MERSLRKKQPTWRRALSTPFEAAATTSSQVLGRSEQQPWHRNERVGIAVRCGARRGVCVCGVEWALWKSKQAKVTMSRAGVPKEGRYLARVKSRIHTPLPHIQVWWGISGLTLV